MVATEGIGGDLNMEDERTLNINTIGFADSEVLSYNTNRESIKLFVQLWDAEILEIKFINNASIFDMGYFRIAEVQEILESPLLDRVLDEYYEVKPEKHPYRIFKFLTSDDMTALEIVCEDVKIRRIKKGVS